MTEGLEEWEGCLLHTAFKLEFHKTLATCAMHATHVHYKKFFSQISCLFLANFRSDLDLVFS